MAALRRWSVALLVFGGGPLLLVLLLLKHITLGEAQLDAAVVWEAILHPSDRLEHHIVRSGRLPRALAGVLAGSALAVAGALLQTLTRNPLASASTLGINAGAYAAVVAAAVFVPGALDGSALWLAWIGGFGAAVLAFALAGGWQVSPVRMALAGMAVTMTLSALTGALQLLFENETSGLFLWGAGTLIQNGWSGIQFGWPWIAGSILAAVLLSRRMDLLELDDETARSLGQNVNATRLLGLLLAVLMAAVSVSVAGPIGFIGLVAPHLIRLLGYRRHLLLLPASAIWGAVVLVGADIGVQLFRDTFGELPVGAYTAVIGAPWLVWLTMRMMKQRGGAAQDNGSSMGAPRRGVSYPVLLTVLYVGLAGAVLAGISLGELKLSLSDLVAVVAGNGSGFMQNIVLTMRLPRTLVAAVAGGALAVSGLMLQGIIRNPLADPSIVGVTSGAGVGALLLMIVWPQLPVALLPAGAFGGAVLAAAVIYAAARRGGFQPSQVALLGIAVSAFGAACIQALVVMSGLRAAPALAWIAGSTYARGWEDLLRLIVWPAALLPIAWVLTRKLDVLGLGEQSAIGLGLRVQRVRLQGAAIAVALSAAAVAIVGTVGFVGLLAPHAANLLVGHHHRRLLPVAALLGALLLVLADVVGRVALAPKEIPSGLVVALIGAPYFLWLMRRSMPKI